MYPSELKTLRRLLDVAQNELIKTKVLNQVDQERFEYFLAATTVKNEVDIFSSRYASFPKIRPDKLNPSGIDYSANAFC